MFKRGSLIVFEGLDETCRSAQSNFIFEMLSQKLNLQVEHWEFPDLNSKSGQLIEDYLKEENQVNSHAFHLLLSANRWERSQEMVDKLDKGINKIVDKYVYSGVALTSAQEDMDFEWCKKSFEGLPKPDLIFFFDSNSEQGVNCTEYQAKVVHNLKKIIFNNEEFNYSIEHNTQNPATIDEMSSIVLDNSLEVLNLSTEMQRLW